MIGNKNADIIRAIKSAGSEKKEEGGGGEMTPQDRACLNLFKLTFNPESVYQPYVAVRCSVPDTDWEYYYVENNVVKTPKDGHTFEVHDFSAMSDAQLDELREEIFSTYHSGDSWMLGLTEPLSEEKRGDMHEIPLYLTPASDTDGNFITISTDTLNNLYGVMIDGVPYYWYAYYGD